MAENQAEIKVSRVSSVTPAIPTSRHRMFLSNLDLSWVPFNNCQNLLFYKISSPEKKFSTIVEMLKRSLSLVLVDFYPLAGRLNIEERESGRLEIDCNDGGVDFIEASIDMAFQELERDDFQHKSFFKELVRTHHNSYDVPLLSVQLVSNVTPASDMDIGVHATTYDFVASPLHGGNEELGASQPSVPQEEVVQVSQPYGFEELASRASQLYEAYKSLMQSCEIISPQSLRSYRLNTPHCTEGGAVQEENPTEAAIDTPLHPTQNQMLVLLMQLSMLLMILLFRHYFMVEGGPKPRGNPNHRSLERPCIDKVLRYSEHNKLTLPTHGRLHK